jgi:hypothetical protein
LQCTFLLYQIECPLWSVTTRFGVWRSCQCTQPAGEPQQLFITQVQAHFTHKSHAMPVQIFSIQNKFWPRRRSLTTIHCSLSNQLSWTWTHAHYGIGKRPCLCQVPCPFIFVQYQSSISRKSTLDPG